MRDNSVHASLGLASHTDFSESQGSGYINENNADGEEISLLVVCGETSSDEHTAPVISWLTDKKPNIKVYGMGGEALNSAGMDLLVDARETASVMGFTEVFGKLKSLFAAYKKILQEVDKRKTKVALLVDFPDFNLRLARQLKARGVIVLYFISPQLWAWRKGRVSQVKKYVDKMLPIFPFEEEFYRKENVSASFVGHPFLDRAQSPFSPVEFKSRFLIPSDKRLVALLPGSRHAEVNKIFPVMLKAAEEFTLKYPESAVHFIVPMAGSVVSLFENYLSSSLSITYIPGHAREVLMISDAAIVASGTATVEAALAGLPFCIVYRVSLLTYAIGKALIRGVSSVGMPNLIIGYPLVHEFIQGDCTSSNLTEELRALLYDSSRRLELLEGLKEVKKKLDKKIERSANSSEEDISSARNSVAERVGNELLSAFQISIDHKYSRKETEEVL
ncbi:MAG TPA: lipid-A-disaccharide synthase [Oligoflexia bacterium]|nr:lipid-A-disaccharide synthase [Oligoflexia bacterium]HMP49382.1 lipid-A-disaccharide synthase [Oligoflexia bacterium]